MKQRATPPEQLARRRDDHARQLELGICAACRAEDAVPGRTKCEACLAIQRARGRLRLERARKDGRCLGCFRIRPRGGGTLCARCRDRRNVQIRRRRQSRKDDLRCGCGREREFEREGKATCRRCAEQNRKAAKRRRSQKSLA